MSKPLSVEQKAARAQKAFEKKQAIAAIINPVWNRIGGTARFSITRKGVVYNTSDMVLFKRKNGSVLPGFFYVHADDYEYFGYKAKKNDWFASSLSGERIDDLTGWMEMPK